MRKNIYAFIFYVFISIFFLRGVMFSSGLIIQEDMAPPLTSIQMEKLYDMGRYSWDFNHLFSYRNYSVGVASLVQSIQYVFFYLGGMGGAFFIKLFLVFVYGFAGFSMFLFLRYLKIDFFVSLFGGLFYITTPVFFNYTIMGWHFVLLVLGFLPLSVKYFIKSIKENETRYAVISGIFYALSFIQSQSVVWFPLIFLFLSVYLVTDKKTFFIYSRNFFIVLFIFFIFNFYAIWGLLVYPDKAVSGSEYIYANASLGMMYNFYPINIIRLWGSIYNYQYETIIFNFGLIFLSFLYPLLAISSLFIKKYRKITIAFWLIAIVPLVFYFLKPYRSLFLYLPFSNVIRDFARFSIFSVFAYSVLIFLSVDYFILKNKHFPRGWKKPIIFFLAFAWFIYLYPWWNGEISAWKNQTGVDSRMVTKVFPSEYFQVEKMLAKERKDFKIMYLPIAYNGVTQITDDKKCRGLRDLFAIYSPKPGLFSLSDRNLGSVDFINLTKENKFKLIRILNVDFIVIRKNMQPEGLTELEGEDVGKVIADLEQEATRQRGVFYKILENDKIIIYSINNTLPHFYIPQDNVVYEREAEDIIRLISNENYKINSAVFLKNQPLFSENDVSSYNLAENKNNHPILEFKKINPTKYRIRVHNALDKFPLVFLETYHKGWRIYPNNFLPNEKNTTNLEKYKILDGNERTQAKKENVDDYIKKGWISDLGNQKERKINHYKWNNEKQKEELEYVEKYRIEFISKDLQGTIQNDNLADGKIWDTWFKNSINNEKHVIVNGYANGWMVDPGKLCSSSSEKKGENNCRKNADGSYDLELIIEFLPQQLFYIGAMVSFLGLLGTMGYLIYGWRNRFMDKKILKIRNNEKNN